MDDVRDQLIAYLRAQKFEKPVIVGHSLGGSLALAIAEQAPELPGPSSPWTVCPFLAAVRCPA